MADRYLSRLVGDVSIGESDAKQRLRDRFEVVCRRSAKLMSEYQLLQTHAEQLRARRPTRTRTRGGCCRACSSSRSTCT